MSGHLLQLALGLIVVVNASFADDADSTSKLVIHSIQVEGNNITQPRVILREMSLHVGDTLSHILLRADRDRIYSLGLFNKVTISHIDSADYADLLISVVERWYIFPYPILSLRTTDVSTLSYGLGVTHQNFLGRDEKLSASYSTGYDRSASFTYQNPRLTDDDDIFLRIAFQYRDAHSLDNSNILFEQVVRMGSGSLGKRFGLFQTLTGTVGYQTWQIPDTSLGRTISPDGTDHFAEIALHYTYDARNIREYPTDGWYLDATATKDGLSNESTIKTLTYVGDARYYMIVSGNSTLALRSFGSFVVGGPVPVYHHIFLSPRLGIRGYDQRQYEGEDMIGGSAEVRVPIITPRFLTFNFLDIYQFNTMRLGVYAAIFTDVGKIWYRSDEFEKVPWLASGGVGLHILLPYSFIFRTELSINALSQLRIAATGGVSF